jgi:threonine dehydratase
MRPLPSQRSSGEEAGVALVDIDQVWAASKRLTAVLEHPTPVERSRAIGDLVGADVWLKCENLQRTGSFKIRGAANRIARLTREEREGGVVCASAGNHAQGVALAASMQGVEATVFMPVEAPLPKVQATEAYGADVRLVGDSFDDTLGEALAFAKERGSVFVHPFDHEDIIAGQGTLGLELLEQVPDLGTVLVPVGGGGLISGLAVALRASAPDVRIVGVQAEGAASFPAALREGRRRGADRVDTIADGIAVKHPGEITWPHVEQLVDEVVTVGDEEIAHAVVLLLERAKQVVEPSGAVGVAAALAGVTALEGTVVPVLSGGNIDPLVLQHLVTSGLTTEGRYATLRTRIPDRPGELVRLLRIVAETRANVVGVEHHRLGHRLRLGQVEVVLELEARGHEHVAWLRETLEDAGYPVAAV